jgi:hypothetical protein
MGCSGATDPANNHPMIVSAKKNRAQKALLLRKSEFTLWELIPETPQKETIHQRAQHGVFWLGSF